MGPLTLPFIRNDDGSGRDIPLSDPTPQPGDVVVTARRHHGLFYRIGRLLGFNQQGEEKSCSNLLFDHYSIGISGTLAAFVGLEGGTQVGVSLPHDITRVTEGAQFYVNPQVSGTLGIGAYGGWGVSLSKGQSQGAMPVFGGGSFAYAEGDVGWGLAGGASWQADASSHSVSGAPPIPKIGAGYGIYAGVGKGYGVTFATPAGRCE